ncbi:MAG: M20/M25/M40 family metallo-hydrolase [Gemmatimonadota bacterium]
MDKRIVTVFFLCLAATGPGTAGRAAAQESETLAAEYRSVAARLIGAALTDEEGWEKLTYLTTRIGHRLSGSPQLEEAIRWASDRMRAEGLENVTLQPVMVPHWVRGDEHARVLAPVERELSILGLGNSVGTPPEGVEAPVIVVGSFDELEALDRERVEGKIVLYAVPWEGYGRTVRYRVTGPSEAAKLGAAAALVRSATGRSLYTPHTGMLRYDEDAPRIPAAAVTVEDAEWMRRMAEAGQPVTVRLYMEAEMLPDAESANLLAEVRGREKPEEVVVMGGHFDSWDVGQGAHDDGAAAVAAWQAVNLVRELGLRPRRTLRVALWTNEENGGRGGEAYRAALGDEVGRHVAAIEMDGGMERPIGFGLTAGPGATRFRPGAAEEEPDPVQQAALGRLREIARLLDGIGAGQVTAGGGGADIRPLMQEGVPGLAVRTVGEHYFDWHHTNSDTLDKVDPANFRKAVAMLAVVGYVLADMPGTLAGPARP